VKVESGSAAEGAGLKSGDVVMEVAGALLRNTSDLRNRMGLLSVGDTAELTVLRDGKRLVIRVTITNRERNIRLK
jgi:S1-C subfamily serine protease